MTDNSLQGYENGLDEVAVPPETELKRYTLTIPQQLFDQLQSLAISEHTTVLDLIRRYIKLGLIASSLEYEDGASLVIRHEGEPDERILWLT